MARKHKRCRRSKNNSQYIPETEQTKDLKSFEATTVKVISSIAEFINDPSLPGPSGIGHKFQSSEDPKALDDEIGEACCLPMDDKTRVFQSSEDPKALDDEIGEACCLPIEDKTDDEGSLYTECQEECHSNPSQSPVPPDYGTPFMCYSPTEDVVDFFYDFPLKATPDEGSSKSRQEDDGILMDQPVHNYNEERSETLLPAETKTSEHGEIQPTANDDTISQVGDQERTGAELKVTEGQGNTTSDKLGKSSPVCDDKLFHEETEVIEPTVQYEEVLADSGPTIANTFLLEEAEICQGAININKCTTDDKMLSHQDSSNLDLQNTELCELKQQHITDVTDDLASGAELIIIAPSDLITSDLKLLKVTETPKDSIKIDQSIDDVQEKKADAEDLQGVSQVEINFNQPTNDQRGANSPSLHIEEANSEPVSDITAKQSNFEVANDSCAILPQVSEPEVSLEVSAPEVLSVDGSREAVDRSTREQIGALPNETGTSRGKKRKHKETRRKKHGSGVRKSDKCDEIADMGTNPVVDTTSTNTTPLMENQNNEYAESPAAISGIEHLSVSDEKRATLVSHSGDGYIAEPKSVEEDKPNSGMDYSKYYAAFHEEEYTLNYDDSIPTVSHYVKPPRRPLKIEAPPKEDKKAEKCPDKCPALDKATADTDNNKDNSLISVTDIIISDVIPITNNLTNNLPLMHPLSACPIFLRLPEIARRQKYPVYTALPLGVCDTCYSSKSALTRMRYTNKNMHRMMKVPGVGAYNRLVFAGNQDDLSYVDTKKNPLPAPEIETEAVGMQYVPAPLMRVPQFPGRPMPPVFLPPVQYGRPYMPFPRMFPLPYPYVPYPYVRFNYPPPIPLFIPPQAFPRPPVFRPPPGPPSFFNIPPYPQNIFFPRESRNASVNRPKMTQNTSVRQPVRETGARPKTFKNTANKAKAKTPRAEKHSESPKAPVLGEFWIRTDKPPNTIPPFGNTKSPTAVDEPGEVQKPVRPNLPEADRTPSKKKKHHGRRKKSRRFTEVVSPAQVSVPGYESIPLTTQMIQQPQFVMPYREMVEDSRDEYYFDQYRNDQQALPPVYEEELEQSDYMPEEEEIEDDFRAAEPAANMEPQKPGSM